MPLKYTVDVVDFIDCKAQRVRRLQGVTLAKARKITRRAMKQGAKRNAASKACELRIANWGGRGGVFPSDYRSACIFIA